MANCFDDAYIETVNHCPNDTTVGGTAADLFYIPAAHIETYTEPTVTATSTYAERMTLAALTPKTGKGFKRLSAMIEENELGNVFVGNKGNKKAKAEIDCMLPNFKPENIGFTVLHKNTPMVYAIKDSAGQFWVIGSPDAPAYFETADAKSGKKYEDNSGITMKISANCQLWAFDGAITELS